MGRWLLPALLLVSACTARGPRDLAGSPVPDVLAAYPNTHTVTVAWYESCPWCKKELAEINERYDELVRANVTVVALNYGDSDELVRATVEERGYEFPVVMGYTMADLPAAGVPYSVFYCHGIITSRHIGYMTPAEFGGAVFLDCEE